MNIKKLIFFIFILSITNATVYFTTPTPENNTNDFTYGIVFNCTDSENNNFSATGNYIELDGTNYTATLASDNKSFSYSLSYNQHVFNHTYNAKCFGNISGTIYEGNETRVVPYYGCGNVNASGTMLGNVSWNQMTSPFNSDCFWLDNNNIVFDCKGYKIESLLSPSLVTRGFVSNTVNNITIKNCILKGMSNGIKFTDYGGNQVTNSTIINNTFIDNNAAIFFNTNHYNVIDSNTIINSYLPGVPFVWSAFMIMGSDYNNFTNNVFINTHGTTDMIYPHGTSVIYDGGIGNKYINTYIFNFSSYSIIETSNAYFERLIIGKNSSLGIINFSEVNGTSFYPLNSSILLDYNFVSLNSTTNPQLNVPANITISTPDCSKTVIFKKSGFPTTYNEIIQGGSIYTPTYSSCSDNIWTFDVEGFSGYAAGYPIYFNDSYASPANGSSSTGISQNVNFTIQITTNGTNPQCNFTINGNNYVGTYNSGICSYYTSITPGLYYWNVTVAIAEGTSVTSGTFLYTLNDPGGGGGGEAPPPESPSIPSETEAETPPQETPPLPPSEEITAEFIELFSATGISPTYIDTRTETIIPPSIIQATGGLIQPLIGSCPIDKSNVPAYLFGIIYCEEVTLYSLFLGKYIWLGWIFFIAMILILIAIVAIKRKDIFDWSMLGGLSINFMFGILILLINSVIITYALRGIGVETYA